MNGRTSSAERLYLQIPELSHVTGVLAEGIVTAWLRSSFSVDVTDEGSKSSSLKANLENGHIPGLAKAAAIVSTVKDA